VTTVIAVVALLLSMISLAFTAYQWMRSGPAVTVDLGGPDGFSEIRYGTTITTEVTSVGRMPATVRDVVLWAFPDAPDAGVMGVGLVPAKLSKKLPAKLEPTTVLEAEFKWPGTGEWPEHPPENAVLLWASVRVGGRQVQSRHVTIPVPDGT
jgi:hypothetical protein